MRKYIISWVDYANEEEGNGTAQMSLEQALIICKKMNGKYPYIKHTPWLVPSLECVSHSE